MDILYLLIPLSVLLVLCILGGLWWAIHKGQFDSAEQAGEPILRDDGGGFKDEVQHALTRHGIPREVS